ncbi:MAG: hypothetical protein WCC92_09925 [Candidatus Korobacteraceae bacterium]
MFAYVVVENIVVPSRGLCSHTTAAGRLQMTIGVSWATPLVELLFVFGISASRATGKIPLVDSGKQCFARFFLSPSHHESGAERGKTWASPANPNIEKLWIALKLPINTERAVSSKAVLKARRIRDFDAPQLEFFDTIVIIAPAGISPFEILGDTVLWLM